MKKVSSSYLNECKKIDQKLKKKSFAGQKSFFAGTMDLFKNSSKIHNHSFSNTTNTVPHAHASKLSDIISPKHLRCAGATVVVACIICMCMLNSTFTSAYEAYLGDDFVGTVKSEEQLQFRMDNIKKEVSSYLGTPVEIDTSANASRKVVKKSEITDEKNLDQNIKSVIDNSLVGYTVIVDGNPVGTLSDRQVINQMLEEVKQQYVTPDVVSVELGNDVQIKANNKTSLNQVQTKDVVLNALKENLSVVTKEYVQYEESIPFTTEKQQDNSVSATTVITQGVDGKKVLEANIVKVNGLETDKEIISENIVATPITQVVKTPENIAPKSATGSFLRPYNGTVTSRFGLRASGMHTGLDLAGPTGSPIKAADNGKVTFAGWQGSYGYLVKIQHSNGYETYYAHCSKLYVSVGNNVTKGSVIAAVGNTGNSTGPHVHFEVRKNGTPLNPSNFI